MWRPLFVTSVLLDPDLNGAGLPEVVVVTGASRKTAYALAHLLRDRPVRTVGLTSSLRRAWVSELGLYDTTLAYDELDRLDAPPSAVLIDWRRSLRRPLRCATPRRPRWSTAAARSPRASRMSSASREPFRERRPGPGGPARSNAALTFSSCALCRGVVEATQQPRRGDQFIDENARCAIETDDFEVAKQSVDARRVRAQWGGVSDAHHAVRQPTSLRVWHCRGARGHGAAPRRGLRLRHSSGAV